jgi:hypothetical protein
LMRVSHPRQVNLQLVNHPNLYIDMMMSFSYSYYLMRIN